MPWLQPEGDLQTGPLSALIGAHLYTQTAEIGVPPAAVNTIGPVKYTNPIFDPPTVWWDAEGAPPLRLQQDEQLVLQTADAQRAGIIAEANIYASEPFRPSGNIG